ncbi:sensor histidine kinase [Clostridium niameyense]|uniref:sensor histidine kinase n=1 Tax=Clostridium niameyense TaxID=1622073 RepID=UPI00067F108A|nr:ATP-binding protein [Clostridium niameyense]
MVSIKKKLGIILTSSFFVLMLLILIFVNITVNNKFNKYLMGIEDGRNERIVKYFEEIYKKEKHWDKNSVKEIKYDSKIEDYYITLLDKNKNIIWSTVPKDNIKFNKKILNSRKDTYSFKNFSLKNNGKIIGYVRIGYNSSGSIYKENENFRLDINRSIIISGIISILIIVIVSFYISKEFSKPIKDISNMYFSLSNGDFDVRSNIKTNIIELEKLKIGVNSLAEKLKQQDMLRKRLVSDISHEIRTPLNILENNLEAMIDGYFEVTNERLVSLNEEVIRFGKLLNNLNVLREFEEESLSLNFTKIDLNQLLKNIYYDFAWYAEEKNIKLIYNLGLEKKYFILGDKDKLKQVIINILSNSLKFMPKGGKIILSLYEKNKKIIVSVEDNGMGIKKEDLPFIFERFYRADKSRNRIEGMGLGLTIIKKIIQLHLATIQVESEEGKGTTFTIFFNELDKNNK